MNRAGFIMAALVAPIAARWVPVDVWRGMSDGILIVVGFYSAALIQVMFLTATFATPDGIELGECEDLTAALEFQLKRWIVFFVVSIMASIVMVTLKVLPTVGLPGAPTSSGIVITIPVLGQLDAVSGLAAFSVTLVFSHAVVFLRALLDLQRTRSRIVRRIVETREAEQRKGLAERRSARPLEVPEDYGRIIEHN